MFGIRGYVAVVLCKTENRIDHITKECTGNPHYILFETDGHRVAKPAMAYAPESFKGGKKTTPP